MMDKETRCFDVPHDKNGIVVVIRNKDFTSSHYHVRSDGGYVRKKEGDLTKQDTDFLHTCEGKVTRGLP